MRDTHTDLQLPTFKTVILLIIIVKWGAILPPGALAGGGGGWGREIKFLDLLHMRNTNTDFQLPTSKTVILLIIVVKWGRFYPLGPSPQGSWGRRVYFPESTSYEGHTYQFSAF